jgi:uncharacterized protein YndB with AHSA1/START domain
MEPTTSKPVITIETTVNAPVEKAWKSWNEPEHITKWNFASDDWHTPYAKTELRPGGNFSARMEAKDGSMGFDFHGVYDEVVEHKIIRYTMGDGRKVRVDFTPKENSTHIVESFEAEETHSLEMQKGGWQAILDNFKKYTESL